MSRQYIIIEWKIPRCFQPIITNIGEQKWEWSEFTRCNQTFISTGRCSCHASPLSLPRCKRTIMEFLNNIIHKRECNFLPGVPWLCPLWDTRVRPGWNIMPADTAREQRTHTHTHTHTHIHKEQHTHSVPGNNTDSHNTTHRPVGYVLHNHRLPHLCSSGGKTWRRSNCDAVKLLAELTPSKLRKENIAEADSLVHSYWSVPTLPACQRRSPRKNYAEYFHLRQEKHTVHAPKLKVFVKVN